MPLWILCAIIAGLASNLYNFFSRLILIREKDSSAFGWFAELTRLAIAVLFLPFDGYFSWGLPAISVIFGLGLVELVSIFLFMKMHAFSQLSISTIMSRMRLVWIPILAFLFIGESLLPKDYIGILVLFFGLGIAVSPKKLFVDKGIMYATFSSVIVAILSIVMKVASPMMSTSWLLISMSGLTTAIYPLMLGRARVRKILNRRMGLKLFAALSNVFSMYFYVYALKIGEVSKVTAIYQGMMIVSIIGGIVFLGEREHVGKKITGAVITLVGVLMLTLI